MAPRRPKPPVDSSSVDDASIHFSHPASLGGVGGGGGDTPRTGSVAASTCGAGVLSSWMSLMLQGMQFPPPSSPVGREPPPPDPMSLVELYDPKFGVLTSVKWREQLLDRPHHCQRSPHDVAEIVMALE
jgi:hypothetical protein